MSYEEVKAKLNDLLDKNRLIRLLDEQIQERRSSCDMLDAVDYTHDFARGGGEYKTAQDRYIAEIERLTRQKLKAESELAEIKDMILECLERGVWTSRETSMIISRYISGWSWNRISREYHYSERQPSRIVRNAIRKISQGDGDRKP